MIQRRAIVKGKVQGVSFRASTLQQAEQYPGLKGYVRNLKDGSVEAVFVGEEKQVMSMLVWCKVGPAAARVSEMEIIEEPVDPALKSFEIRKG